MWKYAAVVLAFLAMPVPSTAQFVNSRVCQDDGAGGCVPVSPATPMFMTANTNVQTYRSAIAAFGNSSAGDVFCVNGGTKLVKVKSIRVTAVASQGISDDIQLIRRSAANTGGTPTAVSVIKSDTLNGAPTATVTAYATAPSTSGTAGSVGSQVISITTTTGAVTSVAAVFNFAQFGDQALVLRGSAEGLCVNVPATAGGQWSIDEEHTEE